MARPAGLEPATSGLAYHYRFPCPAYASLWSGLSLRHLRRRTYSLYGSPCGFPRDCHQHYLLRFPRYSAVHLNGCIPAQGSCLEGRCSIRLSYGRMCSGPILLRPYSSRRAIGPQVQSEPNNPRGDQSRRARSACLDWSGQRDSNSRPSAPKADALPGCAMPRHQNQPTTAACAHYTGATPGRRGMIRGGLRQVNEPGRNLQTPYK